MEAGDGRSVRGETMDYEEEEEREESMGPSRLRGGAGEEGGGRRSDEEMEGESRSVLSHFFQLDISISQLFRRKI